MTIMSPPQQSPPQHENIVLKNYNFGSSFSNVTNIMFLSKQIPTFLNKKYFTNLNCEIEQKFPAKKSNIRKLSFPVPSATVCFYFILN